MSRERGFLERLVSGSLKVISPAKNKGAILLATSALTLGATGPCGIGGSSDNPPGRQDSHRTTRNVELEKGETVELVESYSAGDIDAFSFNLREGDVLNVDYSYWEPGSLPCIAEIWFENSRGVRQEFYRRIGLDFYPAQEGTFYFVMKQDNCQGVEGERNYTITFRRF